MGIETDYGLFHVTKYKDKNPLIALHTADNKFGF